MPKIKIPPSAFQPLKDLVELSHEQFTGVVEAIAKGSPSLSVDRFCDSIAGTFDPTMRPVVSKIVGEFCRMEYGRIGLDMTAKEFMDDLVNTAVSEPDAEFKLTEAQTELLRKRSVCVLEVTPSLNITAKAFGIFSDHGKTFSSVKVISDIRPIFTDDANKVQAAAIVHSLVITYVDEGDYMEFHVALDTNDIAVVRKALDRADIKAGQLKSVIAKSDINFLTPDN